MKKLHFIVICLFYSINAISQQVSHTGEVMRLSLPSGTVKLDEHQLKGLSHRGISENTASYFHDHIYKKNGLLIYYVNLSTIPLLKKSLEHNQTMMVSLLGQIPGTVVDNSKIITINNTRFLIIDYHDKDTMYIRFTSDYDKNNNFINGFIEYNKADEAEAGQYLQDLLQSMHFNNQ